MTWQPISTFNGPPGSVAMISNGITQFEAILHPDETTGELGWYELWSWSQKPVPNVTHWKQIEEPSS